MKGQRLFRLGLLHNLSSCHLHQSHGALKTKKSYGIPMITVDADFENKYDYKNVVSKILF